MSNFDPNAASLDNGGIYGLPCSPEESAVVLVPVPWDVTTSYRPGTASGPEAIRSASAQIDLYDVDTGTPYRQGIAMLDEPAVLREWNQEARPLAESVMAVGGRIEGSTELQRATTRVNELGGQLNDWVRETTTRWLARGKVVGVIGGDHASPFGAIEALAERHPGMGVLHIDAHADLREAYEGFTWSHASIMFNVATRLNDVAKLVQVGVRDLCEAEVEVIRASGGRIVTHFDAHLSAARDQGRPWAQACREIVEELPSEVYVSFDIDGLDPSLCPNTGTPVPGGLSFAAANGLLRALVASGRTIVGFDLCEVAPAPDGDEWDANVGMRLLYKLIGWTLMSRGMVGPEPGA